MEGKIQERKSFSKEKRDGLRAARKTPRRGESLIAVGFVLAEANACGGKPHPRGHWSSI
jgi:hypothetical protein